MKIIFASNNLGKINELQHLLAGTDLEIIPQKKLSVPDISETGTTFVENALLKARHACQQTGLPAIADDSGLIVNALKGAPGIYSARYAGEKANSKDNINKLLNEMRQSPESNRDAYFYCVLVMMMHEHDPTPLICEGAWQGVILTAPRGDNGFGYDPIFFDRDEGVTAAELPLFKKNQISHRAKAMTLLVEKIRCKHFL